MGLLATETSPGMIFQVTAPIYTPSENKKMTGENQEFEDVWWFSVAMLVFKKDSPINPFETSS